MSKFGFDKKKTIHDAALSATVPHAHVPGVAYEISNPAEKLIHIIGGGFFNEPRYYDTNRSAPDFHRELESTGKISSKIVDELGLTEQAREVLEAIQGVINSDHPEDLFIIASWARDPEKGLKLRTTPQMMLTLAAASKRTQPFIRRYATDIMQRIDEVRQVFAGFRHLYQSTDKPEDASKASGNTDRNKTFRGHRGSLPHSLRKGLGQALAETSIYELLKYNSDERPTLKDILLMVGGSRKMPKRRKDGTAANDGWPVSKAVFEYIVNGKVTADAPPIIKAREQVFAAKALSDVTPALLKEAGLTWENITSKFGSNKAVWEMCIPLMGEMALTRNLRNFEEAGISKEAWDLVYEKVGKIKDTVQLPFRFFAAAKATKSTEAHTLIAKQLDQSCENVPELEGTTVVLVDNSGSAVGAVISGKSDLRVSDAGNTLAAIIAKKMGRRAIVGAFGDSLVWVPFNQADSCLTIKDKIDSLAQREERSKNGALAIPQYTHGPGVGGGTETGLWWAIHDLTTRKVKVDRFILLSDLCCYTQGDVNCGFNMSQYFGKNATIQSLIDQYRQQVNSGAYVYSINLSGYGQAQTKSDAKSHRLSGWSEQIFSIVRDIEAGDGAAQKPVEKVEVPTLAVLRNRYRKGQ